MSTEPDKKSLTDQIIEAALAELVSRQEFTPEVLARLSDLATTRQLKKHASVTTALKEE